MSRSVTIPAGQYKLVKLTLPARSVYTSAWEITLDVTNVRDYPIVYEAYWNKTGEAALRVVKA